MIRKCIVVICLSLLVVCASFLPAMAQGGFDIVPYGTPTKLSEYQEGYRCWGNNILPLINDRGDVVWFCVNGSEHWGYYYDSDTGAVSEIGSIHGWGVNPSPLPSDPEMLDDAGQAAFVYAPGYLHLYKDGSGTLIDIPSGILAGGYEMNDSGQIAYLGYDHDTGFWEMWRYDTRGGTLEQISQGGGVDGKINSQGDVIWRKLLSPNEYGIYLYRDGVNTLLATGFIDWTARINDRGHAVWFGHDGVDYEVYFHDGTNVVQLTDNSGGTDWLPQINNRDQIVWGGTNLDPANGNSDAIFFYDHATGQTVQITNDAKNHILPEINDLGQIVWQGAAPGEPTEIYLYSSGQIYQLTNDECLDEHPQINNEGQIVWQRTCPDEGTQVYTLKPITNNKLSEYQEGYRCWGNNILPLINDRGDVVWFCVNGLEHWGYYYDSDTGAVTDIGSIHGWGVNPSPLPSDPEMLNDAGQAAFVYAPGYLHLFEDGNGTLINIPSGILAGGYEMNDNGQIAYLGYDHVTSFWEMWRYDTRDGTLVQISQGGGSDGKINSQGDVIWRKVLSSNEYGIYLYRDGVNTLLATGYIYDPRINDRGHAVWFGYDGVDYEVYFHDGTNVVQLTDNSGGTDWLPQMNNRDQIVWGGTNLDPANGNSDAIFFYDHATGQTVQITNDAKNHILPEINDLGQIVWQGATPGEPTEIYLYSNGRIYQLTNDECLDEHPQLNNKGQLVWQRTCPGEGTEVYMTVVPVAVIDTDGDGTPDASDGCPADPDKIEPGMCGCGAVDGDQFLVRVLTGMGTPVSGARLYAFTGSGSYLGSYTVTDDQGTAGFDLAGFAAGTYKFRLDYLGQQFWSPQVTLPGTCATEMVIEEETAEVTVVMNTGPAVDAKVYLFSATGSYLGQYRTTDAAGKVQFRLPVGKTYKFRADLLGNQYWSDPATISAGAVNQISVNVGGGSLQLSVQKAAGSPLSGVNTYLFAASGSYLGLHQQSTDQGEVAFEVSEGTYLVRADYLGYQFWSTSIHVTGSTASVLEIPHEVAQIGVSGKYRETFDPMAGIKVYLFTPAGSYLGFSATTDEAGGASWELPERAYKVRADYLGKQFWSAEFTWEDANVEIPLAAAEVTVTGAGLPLVGVNVCVFSPSKSYLGLHAATDFSGRANFLLPAGDYQFRADYEGSQFWASGNLVADEANAVSISTGGGVYRLALLKRAGEPLAGARCYVFKGETYLGISSMSSSEGLVSFNLADGPYRVRVDHLGYQFWTDEFVVSGDAEAQHIIPHQGVPITVQGTFQGDAQARSGLPIYVFSASGQYLGLSATSNAMGEATFDLPEQRYQVRADYLGQQFWSPEFIWQATTVTISEGMANVQVLMAGQGVPAVPVYVFSGSGSYLGLNAVTDSDGGVGFRLPASTYQFRADYQGKQFWATAQIVQDAFNPVVVNAGGGEFVLTVDNGQGPLINAKVYAFKESGSYLGLSGSTNVSGQVSFNLADGSYKYRVDYLGYQFWSDVYSVPVTLSGVFSIPHQDLTLTVRSLFHDTEPIAGIKVYLFTPNGSYLSKNAVTDTDGTVVFSLPGRDYKVRADYLGYQFWSEVFNSENTDVVIPHGLARIHVHQSGVNVVGAKVYLLSPAGSYLGKVQVTGADGNAEFVLPDRDYKLRVDASGKQYWTPVLTVPSGAEVTTEVDLGSF